jgi:hypothetical protein
MGHNAGILSVPSSAILSREKPRISARPLVIPGLPRNPLNRGTGAHLQFIVITGLTDPHAVQFECVGFSADIPLSREHLAVA